MQVFNTYFKILRKNGWQLVVYVVVFIVFTVLFSTMGGAEQGTASFAPEEVSVAVIDRDGSALSREVKKHMGKVCTLVELPDETERLQDELFYRNVYLIAILPKGFEADFLKGAGTVETVQPPNSSESYFARQQLQSFLQTMERYLDAGDSPETAAANAERDGSISTQVKLLEGQRESAELAFLPFFQFLSYILMALMILGISMIMLTFYTPDLRSRGCCSPFSMRRQNVQLLMGAGVFALGCWAILSIVSLVMYGFRLVYSPYWWLALLNALTYTVVSVAVGFCVGAFVKTPATQSAAANVISLATSFLAGVFVPQEMLGSGVLKVASFLPTYWYVRLINLIKGMGEITAEALTPVWQALGIQLAFAAAIISLSLYISKERAQAK